MAPPQQHHAFDSMPAPRDKAHETIPLADHVFNSIFDAQVKVLDPKATALDITRKGQLDIALADKHDPTMEKFGRSALALASMDGHSEAAKAAGDHLINRVIQPQTAKPD